MLFDTFIRAAIQRAPDKLKEFLDSKLTEFDQDKCKILQLEQKRPILGLSAQETNPMQVQTADWLSCSCAAQGLQGGSETLQNLHPCRYSEEEWRGP